MAFPCLFFLKTIKPDRFYDYPFTHISHPQHLYSLRCTALQSLNLPTVKHQKINLLLLSSLCKHVPKLPFWLSNIILCHLHFLSFRTFLFVFITQSTSFCHHHVTLSLAKTLHWPQTQFVTRNYVNSLKWTLEINEQNWYSLMAFGSILCAVSLSPVFHYFRVNEVSVKGSRLIKCMGCTLFIWCSIRGRCGHWMQRMNCRETKQAHSAECVRYIWVIWHRWAEGKKSNVMSKRRSIRRITWIEKCKESVEEEDYQGRLWPKS